MKTKWMLIVAILFMACSLCNAQLCGKIKQVSCGEIHSLALMEDKSLMACGKNQFYQLGVGQGTSYSATTLQKVKGIGGTGYLKNTACFDAGWQHSLAADSNGILVSWGDDSYGELGNGPDPCNSDVPRKVHGLGNQGYLSDTRKIVYVSAGRSGVHSLVVDSNGFVYAFGYNYYGQCGIGGTDASNITSPMPVVDDDANTTNRYLGDVAKIVAVDAGMSHSLALSDLSSGGYVWEWGNNNNSRYPRKVRGVGGTGFLNHIVGISTCGHSVVVDSNGFVYEWNAIYRNPVRVVGENGQGYLSNIKAVSAGSSCSIALGNDGRVWKWTFGGVPQRVPAGDMQTSSGYLENITAIAAGLNDFRLAVDNQGYGWGWGFYNEGALGVGDKVSHPNPTKMKCPEVSKRAYLTKTYAIDGSEPDCAQPFIGEGIEDNYLRFIISYGNPTTNQSDPNYVGTIEDVNIVDVLPDEVDFNSTTNPSAVYDANTHQVLLHLDTLEPGTEDSFEITTKVNGYALPLSNIHNYSILLADNYYAESEVNVPVCNWGGDIIYVDKDANSVYSNGRSWDDAYTDIQSALAEAARMGNNITAMWVAAGTYKPVEQMVSGYTNKRFELLNNLALIGHFSGIGTYESSPDQRNLADANNATILEGRIGTAQSQAVQYVVYAKNITNSLIDGFTIKDSYNGAGIYLDNADISVINCRFEKNHQYGIYAYNYSYPDIHNCIFFNNTSTGCYSSGHCQPAISYSVFDGNNVSNTQGLSMNSNCAVTVDGCVFKNHKNYGINGTNNGSLAVTGSRFTNNYYGLSLSDITTSVIDSNIENSTLYGFYCSSSNITLDQTKIENSTSYGFYCSGSNVTLDYSSVQNNTDSGVCANNSDLDVSHCLLAGNNDNGIYTSNGCNLTVNNSIIRRNGGHGLELNDDTTTTIKNSWVNKNGILYNSSYGGAGIYLANTTQTPLIRNDTIYDNWKYGIQANAYGPDPNIRNCIVYENDASDFFRDAGGDPFTEVNFCCLQHAHTGQGNFVDNPMFTNLTDPNDLHLDDDSPCVDAGDPCGVYADEKDIDDEPRNDGRLDIGGDENFWSKADYNEDGTVDFLDYCTFANSWRKTDTQVSLDGDTDVDYIDLALFHRDWLWQRGAGLGWLQSMMQSGCGSESMEMMAMAAADDESIMTDVPVSADNSLMITDVKTSKALRPQRLARKTDAFYAITAETASAPVDVEGLVNWLDEIWNNGDLKDVMTESEYLEFRESLKTSGE